MKKKNNVYDLNLFNILTTRDNDGFSLLHWAAEGGSVDIMKAMIKVVDEVNKHFEMDERSNIDYTTYDIASCLQEQTSISL